MKLKKELGLIDVFSIATGGMISSGLFILPGLAHARAGPGVIVSYFLAGLLAAIGVLCIAELATAMPKAGGDYFFITRGLGPAVGTVAGLFSWISLSLKSTFALVGMATFARIIINFDFRIGGINIPVVGIFFCLLFVFINYIGIKEAGRTQVILVAGLLALLALYIIWGLPRVNVQYYEPFVPYGLASLFSTAGFVFVSYGGLIKTVSVAEEVKNPSKNIPMGMIIAILVTGLLYTLVIFVTSGVVEASQLDYSLTPISDGAYIIMGEWGRIVLGIAAILAFISTANAGIMSASRYPLGLARDNLLPSLFRIVHSKFKTPYVSIIFTGFFIIIALFFTLDFLVKVASTVLILTYILSILSIIILRMSRLQNYKPDFYAPFFPWLQIIGILGFGFILYEMGKEAIIFSLIFIAIGFLTYLFYGRGRTKRKESALLHIIERIMPKVPTSGLLEYELKQIIRERDNITRDRFDRMIEESIVVDIDKSISVDEFFKIASEKLSERLKIKPSRLLRLLMDMEEDHSSVIGEDLAIPNIIIEEKKPTCILLARCKEGIVFSKSKSKVKMVFVFVGTEDERNFLFCSIASIAQIVNEPDFEDNWLQAKDEHALRDIILLGKRKRY